MPYLSTVWTGIGTVPGVNKQKQELESTEKAENIQEWGAIRSGTMLKVCERLLPVLCWYLFVSARKAVDIVWTYPWNTRFRTWLRLFVILRFQYALFAFFCSVVKKRCALAVLFGKQMNSSHCTRRILIKHYDLHLSSSELTIVTNYEHYPHYWVTVLIFRFRAEHFLWIYFSARM